MRHRIVMIVRKFLPYLFYFLPVKRNKIVFVNFNGKGFGCNPKYIALEILKQRLDYDLVWLVHHMEEFFPDGIRKVYFGKIKAMYEVATAKVIITNVKNDLYLVKKKNQYLIQTWHGSYSSKLLEKDAINTLSPKYIQESIKNSKQTDLFLSNSRVLSECYRKSFWCECDILESGFPRNDVLFTKNNGIIDCVKKKLGVSMNSKLVIYAPTFRDDGSMDAYNLDCCAVLNALSKNQEDWRMIIRLHPNVSGYKDCFQFTDKVIDGTSYPDMQELLMACDILITDYSSSVFEFSAIKKPSFIFASDLDNYQKMRGLHEDFFQMPFKICETNDELITELKQYTPEKGVKNAEEFMHIFGGVDQGDASLKVVEHIKKVMNGY